MLPTSPFNETHTDNPTYNDLYKQANATLSDKTQADRAGDAAFDFNQGGYIIPAFIDALDAYSTRSPATGAARVGQPLSDFNFEDWSFVMTRRTGEPWDAQSTPAAHPASGSPRARRSWVTAGS